MDKSYQANQLVYGKVVYYGFGAYGKRLFEHISNKNHIVAIIDKNTNTNRLFSVALSDPNILLKMPSDDYNVILISVMDEELYNKIKKDLIDNYGIDSKKIVHLHKEWCCYMRESRRKRIGTSILKGLFHQSNVGFESNLKDCRVPLIKIRILFGGAAHLWNNLKSLSQAFEVDSRFDLQIVLLGKICSSKYNMIKCDAANVIYDCEYSIEQDHPDIVFMSPYGEFDRDMITKIKKNSKFMCQIPIVLVKIRNDITEHLEIVYKNLNTGFDLSIHDRLLYQDMIKVGVKDSRIVEIGNPKFDNIFNIINSEIHIPSEWKKLEGKKVILLTTDHGWAYGNVTFDLYFDKLIEWFKINQDVGLIFRPHPLYIEELLDYNVWTKSDLDCLKGIFSNSSNMIFDDTPDYSLAYKIANGILCDVNCGIIISALPLGKPLGTIRRYDDCIEEPLHPNIVDNLYKIDSIETMFEFFNMIIEGEDPRKQEREYIAQKSISHFDGKNGERIKEYVIKVYLEKIRKEQEKYNGLIN